MKKLMLCMVAVVLLTMSASIAGAWQVNIKNSCNIDVAIDVKGEHLLWKQIDCTVNVGKGTTGACKLPGALCPWDVGGYYKYNNSPYDLNRVHCNSAATDVCCCWDVNVEVIQYGTNSCRLELR